MSNWVNLDRYFGDPFVTLQISERHMASTGVYHELKACADDPNKLEKVVTEFIVKHRPELAGLILVSMEFGGRGGPMNLRFTVVHSSLPKQPPYNFGPVQWLIPCPICKKGYSVEQNSYVAMVGGGRCEQVCSKECADLKEEYRIHDEVVYTAIPKELR